MTGDAAAGENLAFDLQAYLSRIGLDAPPAATVEGLARVQRAHRHSIPFENLDVVLGRGISLDPGAVFDKLVRRKRGGYCFEQNGLLQDALRALGFSVRSLLGRVWLGAGHDRIPPVTHQLELVEIDGRDWIADAGFGGCFCPPMPLANGNIETGPDGAQHRLRSDARVGWMLERLGPSATTDGRGKGEGWQAQYSFTLDPVHDSDRELSNHWASTRPGARFTSLVITSRILEDGGFLSLNGRELRTSRLVGASETITLDNAISMRDAFARSFDIQLDEYEAQRVWEFTDHRSL